MVKATIKHSRNQPQSMKPKVFVTQPLPRDYLAKLAEKAAVEIWPKPVINRSEFLAKAKGRDGLLTMLTERVDGELFKSAGGQLKIVANYAVGFNNIDIKTATKLGIIVTNTPGVLTEAVAEHVLGLILALTRRIVEGDRLIRAGKYHGWDSNLLVGRGLRGLTLGIVGLGRIGTWTARIGNAMDMKILYYSHHRQEEAELVLNAAYHTLDMLLAKSDVVSLNVPLSAQTRHMIGARELKLMKPTALLINTSRGAVIDEAALVSALREKTIAGAGLDVFENEEEVNPQFYELDNVVLTPHIASATAWARRQMARL